MASWLSRGFCIASAWLPRDPGDSRQLPDQLRVGSSLAPKVVGTVRVLSGRFPKHSRSCPQRRKPPGSFAEDAEALKTSGIPWRCPQDNANSLPKVSRSSFPHPNFALDQNPDARKIRSLTKAPKRAEVFRAVKQWEESFRNMRTGCRIVRIYKFCGRLVLAEQWVTPLHC